MSSPDPLVSLRRLVGALETLSLSCEGAATSGNVALAELAVSDADQAHRLACHAAAVVLGSEPSTPRADEARALARRAGDLYGDAMLSRCAAWVKR
jgi:hypothetical protein